MRVAADLQWFWRVAVRPVSWGPCTVARDPVRHLVRRARVGTWCAEHPWRQARSDEVPMSQSIEIRASWRGVADLDGTDVHTDCKHNTHAAT